MSTAVCRVCGEDRDVRDGLCVKCRDLFRLDDDPESDPTNEKIQRLWLKD
jgi:hypothetical protein